MKMIKMKLETAYEMKNEVSYFSEFPDNIVIPIKVHPDVLCMCSFPPMD
jgi:hypothetical protein